tara:strand:- start:204 stop:536 length:333 start_codon:yes stop_codon:yes gene_type:complete
MRNFCRECVTEHDHRILCASCIAAITVEEAPLRRRLPLIGLLQLSSAVFVLWTAFYIAGQALLLIPSTFHDSGDNFLSQIEAMDESQTEDDTPTEDMTTEAVASGNIVHE